MRHGDREMVTGSLMRTSMEHLHLELGTGESFFDDEYGIWSQLATDCWLKHVRQFQEEHGVNLDHEFPKLCKQTQSHKFLMQMFGAQGYKGNELMLLNQCWCFLHVVMAVDLAVADGSQVCDDKWKGKQNNSQRSAYK
jgi:hypothetical protein